MEGNEWAGSKLKVFQDNFKVNTKKLVFSSKGTTCITFFINRYAWPWHLQEFQYSSYRLYSTTDMNFSCSLFLRVWEILARYWEWRFPYDVFMWLLSQPLFPWTFLQNKAHRPLFLLIFLYIFTSSWWFIFSHSLYQVSELRHKLWALKQPLQWTQGASTLLSTSTLVLWGTWKRKTLRLVQT